MAEVEQSVIIVGRRVCVERMLVGKNQTGLRFSYIVPKRVSRRDAFFINPFGFFCEGLIHLV
jgi:hypothetical protein